MSKQKQLQKAVEDLKAKQNGSIEIDPVYRDGHRDGTTVGYPKAFSAEAH